MVALRINPLMCASVELLLNKNVLIMMVIIKLMWVCFIIVNGTMKKIMKT